MRKFTRRCRVRFLEEKDRAELVRLNEEKSQQLGHGHNLPQLDDPKTKVTFIVEEEGEVLGALIVREVAELTVVGTHPKILLAMEQYVARLKAVGREHDIDQLIGFIPKQLFEAPEIAGRKGGLEKSLERMGMVRLDDDFVVFEGDCGKA